jgi:hypothetical protein
MWLAVYKKLAIFYKCYLSIIFFFVLPSFFIYIWFDSFCTFCTFLHNLFPLILPSAIPFYFFRLTSLSTFPSFLFCLYLFVSSFSFLRFFLLLSFCLLSFISVFSVVILSIPSSCLLYSLYSSYTKFCQNIFIVHKHKYTYAGVIMLHSSFRTSRPVSCLLSRHLTTMKM